MKYMGSKARIAKDFLPLILKNRAQEQWYVEPFCGGCNVIDKVSGNRLANDCHPYLISMWDAVVNKDWKPKKYSKEEYLSMRAHKTDYPKHEVGWVGFNCSYAGKFFRGFAGTVETKEGPRDYQQESIDNIEKQIPNLKGVVFTCHSFENLTPHIPANSIIYCDPPYQSTTKYKGTNKFNHKLFWEWVRILDRRGHSVFVSEYSAPNDFECIWEKEVKSSLSANGLENSGNKKSIERLFVLKKP